ncbi:MAG: hypothetical protein LUQ01_05480 [Methanolinea sp.]|nr:hypothetical protein [Methanolinea sp.]
MVTQAWKLSALLAAGSIAVTVACYLMNLPFFFLFLFIPLIPFFSKDPGIRSCPVCGWETTDLRVAFCPFDGAALPDPGTEHRE